MKELALKDANNDITKVTFCIADRKLNSVMHACDLARAHEWFVEFVEVSTKFIVDLTQNGMQKLTFIEGSCLEVDLRGKYGRYEKYK